MPQIGEVRKDSELGFKGTGKRIWVACTDCGQERWVSLRHGKPMSMLCRSCAISHSANLRFSKKVRDRISASLKKYYEQHPEAKTSQMYDNLKLGHSHEARRKTAIALSRHNSHMWKGGVIQRNGYVAVLQPSHPHSDTTGYVFEHRLVMEGKLGRYLTPSEVVHHENGDKSDNRIENLRLFPNNGDHRKYHKGCHKKNLGLTLDPVGI